MTKRMLIDATHAEETRVVVLDGNRLEDFDVETSTKKQLKGNIYLAKIVRVEPSLQAAFVEYGGGRHGFLAFSEIHPDYYQIPVADRQRLLRAAGRGSARGRGTRGRSRRGGAAPTPGTAGPADRAGRHSDRRGRRRSRGRLRRARTNADASAWASRPTTIEPEARRTRRRNAGDAGDRGHGTHAEPAPPPPADAAPIAPPADTIAAATEWQPESDDDAPPRPAQAAAIEREERFGSAADYDAPPPSADAVDAAAGRDRSSDLDVPPADMPPPETIGGEHDGGEGAEEARARRASRFLRNYKIQEVIKRRQIMLVQVVKEERGTKGAALTTYISLAGRFCVLMPNSPRGGGISRKITSAADRRRLKEIIAELDIPHGMGLIVRTAGANRPKPEIKRDCEYLLRLWDDIREHTLKSVAPALIYEEASLIKRAIRDVYSRDIDEMHRRWRGRLARRRTTSCAC